MTRHWFWLILIQLQIHSVGELKHRLIQFWCNSDQDIINRNQRYHKNQNKSGSFWFTGYIMFEVRLNFLVAEMAARVYFSSPHLNTLAYISTFGDRLLT